MSDDAEAGFELDARLAADTAFVADWPLCRVLLMDDARFPWLVLVPRRAGLVELDEMIAIDRAALSGETSRAMATLRAVTPCDKLNVGALGNIVRQLHVHVVARRTDDAAWPGPVWGHGSAQSYSPEARDTLLARLRQAL
ncbi:MAG: HIT domain-containing protem [Rhodanobacteraceae bacterium]|jgi:diadenosine tetraphosphate (Ap4A) HIT family hydrolase|nr:MAG: HIT domain-containing protem [Rhodanobacteraceae bacterium]